MVSTARSFGRDILVPCGAIARSQGDGGTLRLRLSTRDLEELPTYVPASYGTSPTTRMLSAAYGQPYAGYVWPPWGPSGLRPYGRDVEPFAERRLDEPYAGTRTASRDDTPQVAPTIGKGAVVCDVDGGKIGVVDAVHIGPETGRLDCIVFRSGGLLRTLFGGGGPIRVSAAEIAEVGEQRVRLNSAKEAYDRLMR